MDVIRYYAEEVALCDKDVAAYYDRIIPVLLAYDLLRLGLPIELVHSQCRWLKNIAYSLRMQHRLTQLYSSEVDRFLFDTGQGTGWLPLSWSSLSDLINRVMEKQAPGILLTAPDWTRVDRILDVFIDDVHGGLTTDGLQRITSQPPKAIPKCSTIHAQT